MIAAGGTFGDNDWDLKEAQVVCRELVDPNALSALISDPLGEGNGHIWLDYVLCRGNERSIDYCQHRSLSLSLIMLCHARICTIKMKLQKI